MYDGDSEMFQKDMIEESVQYLNAVRESFDMYFPEEQNKKIKINFWFQCFFVLSEIYE